MMAHARRRFARGDRGRYLRHKWGRRIRRVRERRRARQTRETTRFSRNVKTARRRARERRRRRRFARDDEVCRKNGKLRADERANRRRRRRLAQAPRPRAPACPRARMGLSKICPCKSCGKYPLRSVSQASPSLAVTAFLLHLKGFSRPWDR